MAEPHVIIPLSKVKKSGAATTAGAAARRAVEAAGVDERREDDRRDAIDIHKLIQSRPAEFRGSGIQAFAADESSAGRSFVLACFGNSAQVSVVGGKLVIPRLQNALMLWCDNDAKKATAAMDDLFDVFNMDGEDPGGCTVVSLLNFFQTASKFEKMIEKKTGITAPLKVALVDWFKRLIQQKNISSSRSWTSHDASNLAAEVSHLGYTVAKGAGELARDAVTRKGATDKDLDTALKVGQALGAIDAPASTD